MTLFRTLAVAAALAIGWCATSLAQQPHWLLGTWQGELRGLPQNPTGNKRVFTVRSVSPDGSSAQGTWGTEAGPVAVNISISGQTVTFTPPSTNVAPGNAYRLEHRNNVLEGSWTSSTGRSGGVTLTKKQ